MSPATVESRWRWSGGIGVRYGHTRGGPTVCVAQPLMTSPWWVIDADRHADLDTTFVRIFPTAEAAIAEVERAYTEVVARTQISTTTKTVVRARYADEDRFFTVEDVLPGEDPAERLAYWQRSNNMVTDIPMLDVHLSTCTTTTTFTPAEEK